jgi:GAF domain-containing protein
MHNLSQDSKLSHTQSQNAFTHDATEAQRLEVLRKTSLLDSSDEEAFDRLTRLACHVLKVPISLVSLLDDRRQFLKSQMGLKQSWCELREIPLSHSFCKHVVISGEPLVINDSRNVDLFINNKGVTELNVIAYLGVPLRLNSGIVLGTLCAIDHKPKEWSPDDIEILSTLAASAVSEIELRLSHKDLDEMIKTISHDLKNPIGAIQLSVQMMNRKLNEQSKIQEIKKGLDKILALSKKLNFLVTNLLDRSMNLH